mmetsp:Transcript_47799/g.107291  ORF Transcript_47799/g.107291 Transcript_47799/m.107291 type:complete len:557 (+) Transcript_47799:155-1825(+)
MIEYSAQGTWIIRKLFVMNGSVFPSAFTVAFPCALVAMINKVLIDADYLTFMKGEDSILSETQAWSGFSFLVGFLIVFRTSQAYNRFWDGCTATHQMRAEWFDGCSALVAFSEYGRDSADVDEKLWEFRGILVRLFSMLHAVALAELEVINAGPEGLEDVAAFKFNVLDPGGLDQQTLSAVRKSSSKVELVYSWIQCVIVQNMKTGVLAIPPPILSRAFQEIANGMVAFHDAVKITYIPFPFPYAQTCDCLLVMHWVCTPLVVSQWVSNGAWAALFVFIQVFILWALNFIAIEIENPFGTDPNDLDGDNMQQEMNKHLLLLLKADCTRCPKLAIDHSTRDDAEGEQFHLASFYEVWKDMTGLGEESEVTIGPVFNFTHGHVHAPRRKRNSHMNPSRDSTVDGVPRVTVTSKDSGDGSQKLRLSYRQVDSNSGVASKRSSGAQSSSARDSSGTSMFPILEASSPNAEVAELHRWGSDLQDPRADSKISPSNGSETYSSPQSDEGLDGPARSGPRSGGTPPEAASSQPPMLVVDKAHSDAAPGGLTTKIPARGILELI